MLVTDAVLVELVAIRKTAESLYSTYVRDNDISAYLKSAGLMELKRAWLRATCWQDAFRSAIACVRAAAYKYNLQREVHLHSREDAADDDVVAFCRKLCEVSEVAFDENQIPKLKEKPMTTETKVEEVPAAPVVNRPQMIAMAEAKLATAEQSYTAQVASLESRKAEQVKIVSEKHQTMLQAELAKLTTEFETGAEAAKRRRDAAVTQWQGVIDSQKKAMESAPAAAAVDIVTPPAA